MLKVGGNDKFNKIYIVSKKCNKFSKNCNIYKFFKNLQISLHNKAQEHQNDKLLENYNKLQAKSENCKLSKNYKLCQKFTTLLKITEGPSLQRLQKIVHPLRNLQNFGKKCMPSNKTSKFSQNYKLPPLIESQLRKNESDKFHQKKKMQILQNPASATKKNVSAACLPTEHLKSTQELVQQVSVHSGSNWNLPVLVFLVRGKPEYPEKNLSEQGENQQQTNNNRANNKGSITLLQPLLN